MKNLHADFVREAFFDKNARFLFQLKTGPSFSGKTAPIPRLNIYKDLTTENQRTVKRKERDATEKEVKKLNDINMAETSKDPLMLSLLSTNKNRIVRLKVALNKYTSEKVIEGLLKSGEFKKEQKDIIKNIINVIVNDKNDDTRTVHKYFLSAYNEGLKWTTDYLDKDDPTYKEVIDASDRYWEDSVDAWDTY